MPATPDAPCGMPCCSALARDCCACKGSARAQGLLAGCAAAAALGLVAAATAARARSMSAAASEAGAVHAAEFAPCDTPAMLHAAAAGSGPAWPCCGMHGATPSVMGCAAWDGRPASRLVSCPCRQPRSRHHLYVSRPCIPEVATKTPTKLFCFLDVREELLEAASRFLFRRRSCSTCKSPGLFFSSSSNKGGLGIFQHHIQIR